MKTNRFKKNFFLMAVIIGLFLGLTIFLTEQYTLVAGASPTDTQPITNKDIVRNGGFDQWGSYNAPVSWVANGTGSSVDETGGQDGGPAMLMEGIVETQVTLFQELLLPTQTTAVAVSFDYRLKTSQFYSGGAGTLWARIITQTGTIATLLEFPATVADSGWQSKSVTLDASAISAVQSAHAAGQSVYIIFDLVQTNANDFNAWVDNVSFKVDGSQNIPAWTGSIAYIGQDSSGNVKTVNRIDPDGGNQQILWTHPGTIPATNAMYDVAWKPDASEVAFSSNHESGYSAFHTDVYGISPDGSNLRRITNPPSKAEIDAGSYQMGTVTGKVLNNYSTVNTVSPFLIYVEGAKEPVSVNIGNYGDTVDFSVPNVADLGSGLHYVVFTWSNLNCANGKEYAAAVVDVQPGGTADAGTLSFNGTCGKYNSDAITWKRDGAEVAADVITPRKFVAAGETIGADLFNAPLTADEPAWSPVDSQILYRNSTFDAGTSGIYLTTEGGGTGTFLVADGSATWVTPAWLPDGSGFVYAVDNYLYAYNLSSSQVTTLTYVYDDYILNPSVSPDGNYVVFEWWINQYDLWILDRNNPVERWQLTANGKSMNPDWSRQNPPSSGGTPLSNITVNGPASGLFNVSHTFTATVTPADATQPITYTWQASKQTDVTHTDGGLSDTAAFNWNTTGTKHITVTAQNGANSKTTYHTITINDGSGPATPPASVSLSGPTGGITGTTYTFNAAVLPANATTPFTYTWQASELTDVTRTGGGLSDTAAFNWNTVGAKGITITVSNISGTVTNNYAITLVPGQRVYLPLVLKN